MLKNIFFRLSRISQLYSYLSAIHLSEKKKIVNGLKRESLAKSHFSICKHIYYNIQWYQNSSEFLQVSKTRSIEKCRSKNLFYRKWEDDTTNGKIWSIRDKRKKKKNPIIFELSSLENYNKAIVNFRINFNNYHSTGCELNQKFLSLNCLKTPFWYDVINLQYFKWWKISLNPFG